MKKELIESTKGSKKMNLTPEEFQGKGEFEGISWSAGQELMFLFYFLYHSLTGTKQEEFKVSWLTPKGAGFKGTLQGLFNKDSLLAFGQRIQKPVEEFSSPEKFLKFLTVVSLPSAIIPSFSFPQEQGEGIPSLEEFLLQNFFEEVEEEEKKEKEVTSVEQTTELPSESSEPAKAEEGEKKEFEKVNYLLENLLKAGLSKASPVIEDLESLKKDMVKEEGNLLSPDHMRLDSAIEALEMAASEDLKTILEMLKAVKLPEHRVILYRGLNKGEEELVAKASRLLDSLREFVA